MTARRYARIARSLGYACRIVSAYSGQEAACLVALHARKSAKSVLAYRAAYPRGRIILVLTGTDVYRDIGRSAAALRAMRAADVLVTLQPDALLRLPAGLHRKARAVIQSAPPHPHASRRGSVFRVCVLGHLRAEKDPMRAASAAHMLDPRVKIEIVHAGALLEPKYANVIGIEMRRNPRYRYVGELPRSRALRLLASSDLLVQSSRIEGGANTICEALACGTPVIASRISGNVGILGARYPGLYDVGDTRALARLLERAATSRAFYARLKAACAELRALVDPVRERRAWESLLA